MPAAAFALLLPSFALAFTVSSFHPEGQVKAPRQARAVFSEPMVSFGDPRAEAPFEVSCSAKGRGLWEDSRTWIYEFESELGAGESCRFLAKKALKSQKGSALQGKAEFRFDTGGPAVKRSEPYEGSLLEPQPAFLLWLDGAVDESSLDQNVYLLVEGLPERIPLRALPAKTRDEMAKRSGVLSSQDAAAALDLVALESTRPLPPNTRVQLVWGKGIKGKKGGVSSANQMLAFRTQLEFTVSFSCLRENEHSPCLPIGGMSLYFTFPVPRQGLENVTLKGGGLTLRPRLDEKEEFLTYLSFKGPFPPSTKFTLTLPRGLRDELGRSLANEASFPLEVQTGAYPPLAKFSAPFGLLEAAEPVLPVTVRAVEGNIAAARLEGKKFSIGAEDPVRLMGWVAKLRSRHDNYIRWEQDKSRDLRGDSLLGGASGAQRFVVPKPGGTQAFEVIGIPLASKGFHVVELESQLLGASLLGKPGPMFVAAGALVTNLAVHFKWGAESSLVWVTSLDSGKPVAAAKIKALGCDGKVVWEGVTGADGAALSEKFPAAGKAASCQGKDQEGFRHGLMVIAEKGGDFSFVHSDWDDGIESWRFQVPTGHGEEVAGDEGMAHTVFDRTLLRAGQEVHMKHFLREKYLRGIRFRQKNIPKQLVLVHSGGRRIVMPLSFGAGGIAETSWKIPEDALLGTYSVYLTAKPVKQAKGANGQEEEFHFWEPGVYRSGSFRVEEFRLPVLAGTVQWPAGPLVGLRELSVDLSVRYLAGGGAGGLPLRLRARAMKAGPLSFEGFEGMSFANGGVATGRFGSSGEEEASAEKTLSDQSIVLDAGGAARASLTGIPDWDLPARVAVEAEFRDPNGEVQAVSRDTLVYPAEALVSVMPEGWAAQKDKVRFRVAVVSVSGKPLEGRAVRVEWLERQNYTHRKRIVGGFYAYESFEEVRGKGSACSGTTDARGLLFCEGKAPATGRMVLVAETEEKGRKSRAHHDVYVSGGEDWWFSQDNDDRIDILPERKAYEAGETARFQVRSPFRHATALVTVEREGVIDRFLREVDGSNPVIEVPVAAAYAPNVFVSAFLVRGRVGEPKATALVDLAKPAHKLGIAEISVGWKAHRLQVSVSTDRAEYRVRDKAKVKVSVLRAADGKPAAGGEVLLAAVDEALLELMPNESWKLLEAMMGRRVLKVQTATAQAFVVGKRHFGLKALPAGGGGGQSSSRELFDTLLHWKARLTLDEKGEAHAEVPMNDSLSSFRIVAVASEGAGRFGTGHKSVRTRQDLMLFSGVAPLARHGDRIFPEVTVRNGGQGPLKAELTAKAGGKALAPQSVELAPGEAKTVHWETAAPADGGEQIFEFEAKAAGGARDSLKVKQKLEAPLRESVLQATLERVEGRVAMPVVAPAGMLPGSGAVGVKLSRSLAAGLEGVRRYMKDYPYGCLEQRVSRAVALRDEKLWASVARSLPSHTDGNGLLKYFPEARDGSATLTSYVLAVAEEAGYKLPADDLARALAGLQGFVSGTTYQAGFVYPAADLAIRKLAAMEALSRYQSFDPKHLALIQIEPNLWPVRALVDWRNILRREKAVPERAKRLAEADGILRARLEWRGTAVGLKGEQNMWWLMSSVDEEANRLLLSAAADEAWKGEIGRLARGAVGRMRGGRWDLTTANAWGVLAMEKFSAAHEKDAVSGLSRVRMGEERAERKWGSAGDPPAASFPWPVGKEELSVAHEGGGRPWALLEARAAVRLGEPLFKGYVVKRTVAPVEQREKGKWSAGDVYRVTLVIDAHADMTWVAVADPVPAGASVLGSGLGNDSSFLTKGEKKEGSAWGAFEERGFSGYRVYHEWMPKGRHQLEYTVRLNGAGEFQLPNTRVEAMYAPEMYAELPNETIRVQR